MKRIILAASLAVLIGAAPAARDGGDVARGGNGALPLDGGGNGSLPLGGGLAGGGTGDQIMIGNGSLPLRLPGDGSLPLKLSGLANAMAGGTSLQTEVTITQAVRNALQGPAAGAFACKLPDSNDLSKHTASGVLQIGPVAFTIKGICYHKVTKNMEVVAERKVNGIVVEHSVMTSLLATEEPSQLAGRLEIGGAGSDHAGRYAFDVRRHEPNPAPNPE